VLSDLHEVQVQPVALERLAGLLGSDRARRFADTAETARVRLAGRRVINVNSTATGGGVAELLQTLLAYARGADIDARWIVMEGDARFFEITKRIHNHLYGTAGDGGPLGDAERRHYEEITLRNVARLRRVLAPDDLVVLHDPQTAALTRHLTTPDVKVVWRCHVGIDTPNKHSEQGWAFLRTYLDNLDAYVFSCAQFAPAWVPADRLAVIAPSIDPFSAKNEPMDGTQVMRVLHRVGILDGNDVDPAVSFPRRDGSRGIVERPVNLFGTGPAPSDVPIVLQASRWDAMKDMRGVLIGFAESIAPHTDAHLILAGPATSGVADDPEADDVLQACLDTWSRLPDAVRSRIHLVCVPMTDPDEAASIVNALQRHATVVVQKSLAEGFGLTVTEAMWKSRPVVGSRVGGIVDQIIADHTGSLVNPTSLDEYATAVRAVLADPEQAQRMGTAAHDRARDNFIGDRHLEQWAQLLERLA
jgi:trehalose synthase